MRSARGLLSVVGAVLPGGRGCSRMPSVTAPAAVPEPTSVMAVIRRKPPEVTTTAGAGTGWILRLAITRQLVAGGVQVRVDVAGDIDMATAPVLAEALEHVWHDTEKAENSTEIVVDLRNVEFLSAAGIHVLIHAHDCCRDDGIGLRVIASHPAVTRPLQMTGMSHILRRHFDSFTT